MRISPEYAESNLDAAGNVIVSTPDFSVLSAASLEDLRGRMGTGESGYGQFSYEGAGPSGVTAGWSGLGDLPEEAVVLLSARELTITSPDDENADNMSQLSVWGRWPLVLPPSSEFGEDEGVVLPWTSTPGRVNPRGLFAPATDVQARVRAGNGCVWVVMAGGLTCLDFCTDTATFYQDDAGRRYVGGLLPDSISDDPYGDLEPGLACAALPYRSVDVFATRDLSYAAVVGGDSVSVLDKKFSVAATVHAPTETVSFEGFAPTDVSFLRDGSVLLVGTKQDAAGSPVGTLGWCLRAPVTANVFGSAAWEGPFYGPEPFDQFTPKIAKDGRWVWVSSGVGHVWRFSDPETEISSDTDLAYWAGPNRAGDPADLSVEPKYRSVYAAAAVAALSFDKGLPVLLQVLGASQGGGSLLCCFNRGFTKVLWRRYYRQTMTGMISSPMKTPNSRTVTPGRSLDPPLGRGPNDRS